VRCDNCGFLLLFYFVLSLVILVYQNSAAGTLPLVNDSPDTARRDIHALHLRYITKLGCAINGKS
jgi:hypothetical protein